MAEIFIKRRRGDDKIVYQLELEGPSGESMYIVHDFEDRSALAAGALDALESGDIPEGFKLKVAKMTKIESRQRYLQSLVAAGIKSAC